MTRPTWDDCYREGNLPWDTGAPDPVLVAAVESGRLPTGRVLEIGCGTGTNARYLTGAGYEVVAVDLSPTAVHMAAAHAEAGGGRYEVHDILAEPAPGGPFDAVFDRGVFHVFDDPQDRATFARRVAEALRVEGVWLSLIGSTEGPARDHGPPRRSARDVVGAIEPALEIVELRDAAFPEHEARAWLCLSRKRAVVAQPSSRH